jgi:drug/metabolite transporter (DMT)-like permease
VGISLTFTAAILLLLSAATHAGWNLLGKRQNPSAAFMLIANTLGLLWLVPVLFVAGRGLAFFSPLVWLFVVLTGLAQAGYFFALTGAYRSGDLSIAYPLARSAPVVMVAIASILLGRSGQISPLSLAGMFLVTAGGFLLPMQHFTDLRLKNYLNLTSLLALLTALCTTAYSLIDDQALRILRQMPGMPLDTLALSALYSLVEAVSCSLWLAFFVLLSKQERQRFHEFYMHNLGQSFLVGALIILAYTLVLIAMAYVSNVSYVIAFRQLSIIIGALLGMRVLKESAHPPKFAGLAVMFAGLVLVGIG